MPRRAAAITEAEIARAVRGARAAGLELACVRVQPDGTILLIVGAPPEIAAIAAISTGDDLDRELAEFEAKHG